MLKYVIRHGETGVKRNNRSQYGEYGPPLNLVGILQARTLSAELQKLGIDPLVESISVSDFLRTHQTAREAGFSNLCNYSSLNEISTGLPKDTLKSFILKRQLPQVVLDKAQALLDNPPKEKIWITHGLVIMGLHQLLGISEDPFYPPHCGINILNL